MQGRTGSDRTGVKGTGASTNGRKRRDGSVASRNGLRRLGTAGMDGAGMESPELDRLRMASRGTAGAVGIGSERTGRAWKAEDRQEWRAEDCRAMERRRMAGLGGIGSLWTG